MNLDYAFMWESLGDIVRYTPVTLQIVAGALLIAVPFGLLFAIILKNKVPVLSWLIRIYASIIKGTPEILQIYVVFNWLPSALDAWSKEHGWGLDVFGIEHIWYAYFVLSLGTTVMLTDAFRSAIEAVDPGQLEAAYSVGMTRFQAYKRILLPQALGVAVPIMCNTIIVTIKNSSLAFALAVVELTAEAKILASSKMRYFEAYLDIFLIYIVLISLIELAFRLWEKRLVRYKAV